MGLLAEVHHTTGGVGTDASARIVDLDGHAIQHLFAAGGAAKGMHCARRFGRCAITDCLMFGRIDAKNAAMS